MIKKDIEEIDQIAIDYDVTEKAEEKMNYAGFSRRLTAYTIDNLLLSFISLGVFATGCFFLSSLSVYDLSVYEVLGQLLFPYLILSSFIQGFYFIYFIAITGQTPGKWICSMKVVSEDGSLIGFSRAAIRFFGYYLSMIMYVGFLMIPFTEKKQGLHDKLARSVVVKINRTGV